MRSAAELNLAHVRPGRGCRIRIARAASILDQVSRIVRMIQTAGVVNAKGFDCGYGFDAPAAEIATHF